MREPKEREPKEREPKEREPKEREPKEGVLALAFVALVGLVTCSSPKKQV
jgi:hypothetical protein